MGGGGVCRTRLGDREARVFETCWVWRDLMTDLKERLGMVPSTRCGARWGRKRDWRVCFLLRGPEGEVTVG